MTGTMRRPGWPALAAAAGMAFCVVASVAAPSRPSVHDRLRDATVFIGVFDPVSNDLRASGTGFLVSPVGDVLTTFHLASIPGELRVVYRSGRPAERRVRAALSRQDRYGDLALLGTALRDTPYLKIADSERTRESESVAAAGYPRVGVLETDGPGPEPSIRKGVITGLRRSRYGGLVRLEFGGRAEDGSSGSPVVNSTGAVLGMVVAAVGPDTLVATPSRRLLGFAAGSVELDDPDRRALQQWLRDPAEQVQQLYESGRYPEARALLLPELKQKPNSTRLIDLHSGIADRLGDLDDAVSSYRRLARELPRDPRVKMWLGRAGELAGYRGDGNPRNNLVISAPPREEVTVVDAGAGRVLETLHELRLSPYARYRSEGHHALSRSSTALVAVDLAVPQEAIHLRRDRPELGTSDWISTSRDGEVAAAAFSPADEPSPNTSIVVYRGAELRETAVHRLTGYFPSGYVTADGQAAYISSLVPRSGAAAPMVRILRLDLATGRTHVVVSETPMTVWMSFPAEVPVAYLLGLEKRVSRLDLVTGAVTSSAATGINDIEPAPEPGRLLLGGRDLLVWDAAQDRELQRIALPFEAYQVGTTPDGAYYFAADGPRERLITIHRETGRTQEIRLLGTGLPSSIALH